MERWNSLSASQKGLVVGLLVVVLIAIVALSSYAVGVRCGTNGGSFSCGKVSATSTIPAETEVSSGTSQTDKNVSPLSESSNRPEPIYVSGDAIVVNDQPAGPIVEVTMLTLSQPSWVAVYEDSNGAPGRVLGAARFEEGIHLGEISLLRSTSPNHTYYLILHADTESRDFDLKKNALLMANGSSIRASFHTFNN